MSPRRDGTTSPSAVKSPKSTTKFVAPITYTTSIYDTSDYEKKMSASKTTKKVVIAPNNVPIKEPAQKEEKPKMEEPTNLAVVEVPAVIADCL
jgi:hypothetical protein